MTSESNSDPTASRRNVIAAAVTMAAAGAAAGGGAPLIVPVELRQGGGQTIRLLSTIATLGTAEDITLRELRIEAFYPAAESPGQPGIADGYN